MLVSLLDKGGGVEGLRNVLGDVDTQKPDAGDTLNLHSIDTDGGVCAIMSSLVFFVLRAKVLLAHHTVKCWTSSL